MNVKQEESDLQSTETPSGSNDNKETSPILANESSTLDQTSESIDESQSNADEKTTCL